MTGHPGSGRGTTSPGLWAQRERLAPWVAAAAVIATAYAAVRWEVWVAAAADPYGYVSQALHWLRGELRVPLELAPGAPWPNVDWTLCPLGYRPATVPGAMVASYPPGLPLLMAALAAIAGPRAVFWVVPITGLAVIVLTYRLGRLMHSATAGAASALIVASSAVFLHQLIVPMSDVPATAWWLGALLLVLIRRPALAGACATAAFLTRPNLAPLAMWLSIAVVLVERRAAATWWRAAGAFALFAAPLACGLAFQLWLDWYLYGNPFHLGYGGAQQFYALANIPINLARYPRWLLETQTVFPFIGLAAPFIAWRARRTPATTRTSLAGFPTLVATGVVLIVVASYLPYWPWPEWRFLRFLLPALPLLTIMATGVVIDALERVPAAARAPLLAAGLVLLVAYQIGPGHGWEVTILREIDGRYEAAGLAAGRLLPSRAVLLSGLESGSLRFYSGRITMRFDALDPAWLDRALDHLRREGYAPFFVLEPTDEVAFRARFLPSNALGRLDWPPYAEVETPVRVRIYDPTARARFVLGEPMPTMKIGQDGKLAR